MNPIVFLLIIITISSYIIICSWKNILSSKENFENSQDIMMRLSKSVRDADVEQTNDEEQENQTDSSGNTIKRFKTIDTSEIYENILKSEDLVIDKPKPNETPKFEILDQIVKDDKNIFRSVQFKNNERETLPKAETTVDFKNRYSKNYVEIPMQERSLNLQMDRHKHNGKIDIEDPISDAYLPYYDNTNDYDIKPIEQNNIEYQIISLYKSVLDRNPTPSELHKHTKMFIANEVDIDILRVNLMNSIEYRRNTKMQSNDVSSDMEYGIAKQDLIQHIAKLYFLELGKEVSRGMLMPLKDIWIYLQGNEFLFRAFLIHDNYPMFEKDVIDMKLLTKAGLSKLIDRYYILYDLKLKAHDIQREDVLKRRGSVMNIEVEPNEKKDIINFQSVETDKDNGFNRLVQKIEDESAKLDISHKINYNTIENLKGLRDAKNKIINTLDKAYSLV